LRQITEIPRLRRVPAHYRFLAISDHPRQPASEALEHAHRRQRDQGDAQLRCQIRSAVDLRGTKQRFFGQLLLSMKLPSLLPAIDTAIAEGQAVVVQLVSTAEAMLDRRLADLSAEERAALEIDLSPANM
jgi:hypothetical protein